MKKTAQEIISVIGLGYVGLPVAAAFAKHFETIGFDINEKRISELKSGYDRTNEVSKKEILSDNLTLTCNIEELRKATFHIVTVPTPIDKVNRPDLSMVFSASKTVAKILKKDDMVVYESTVYPGVTEEECVPLLEQYSGLKCGVDFKVGYSPERINPGDKIRRFETIQKVVSGMDIQSTDRAAGVYGTAVTAGVFKASSIKVAEAAKVIENSQRDINIAFVNELSRIFDKMNIDTHDVLEAAGTKWNFLKFTPGLVGGHCIGVDPYYLTHKAESLGYHPEVILAGRRINDGMGLIIAMRLTKLMISKNININKAKVLILGVTFKENCPDTRNSRVVDVIRELIEFGCEVNIYDPHAIAEEVEAEYGIKLSAKSALENMALYDGIVLAVSHNEFKDLDWTMIEKERQVIFDVKGQLPRALIDGRL